VLIKILSLQYLYADDSKIYKVIRNESDQQKLQSVMNLIKDWSDEWLLRLNVDLM